MLQLHLGVLLLGGSGLFAKLIDLPAIDIIAYRSLFTAIFLFLILKFTHSAIRLKSIRDYKIALILGVLAGVHWLTYFMSIQKTSVAVAMIAMFTYPVMTVLLEPLFQKRLPNIRDVIVSIVVLFGLSLLFPNFWQQQELVSDDYFFGLVLGLFSALCFALRNIGISHYFKQYSGAHGMFYQFLVTAVMLLPFVGTAPTGLEVTHVELLVILTIFFTAAPHVLFANSLAKIPAKTVGIIAYLQPLYGTLLAMFLLSETPTLMTLVGGAIILSAALFETMYAKKRE